MQRFEDHLYTPQLIIHPSKLILYSQREYKENEYNNRSYSYLNTIIKKSGNRLSKHAISKCKKAIDYLVYTSSSKTAYNNKLHRKFTFKLAFITLTLSAAQLHRDKTLKHDLLHQFLIEAKRKWKVTRYVWRQEYQPVSGNWHIHIIINQFVPYMELRNTWNRIQSKLGYIKEFEKKYNHKDANSTDIHSIKALKDIKKYITKYITKSNRKTIKVKRSSLNLPPKSQIKIQTVSNGAKQFIRSMTQVGRIWGCSYDLSNIQGAKLEQSKALMDEIERLQKLDNVTRYDDTYFSVIYINSNQLNAKLTPLLYKYFTDYILQNFNFSPPQLIFNENDYLTNK
jgi:hypothetical protein